MDIPSILRYYGLADVSGFIDQVKVKCCFHLEDTASLNIYCKDESYYCFGCEARGSIIQLVAHLEATTELGALLKIAKIGASITPYTDEFYAQSFEELREGAYIFHTSLPKVDWASLTNHYMFTRGFDAKTLRRFDVRINPSSTYPVSIPIRMNSRFKGYVIKRTDGEEPKYLYSKGFQRTRTLFGSVKKGRVLLAECVFDAMAAVQFGYDNSCASLGWSISEAQAALLQKTATSIICALDNDKKGDEGFIRLRSRVDLPVVRFLFPSHRKDIREMTQTEFDFALARAIYEADRATLREY